jgi:hypothetical protein
MHDQSGTIESALVDVPYDRLSPGAAELERLQEEFR